MYVCMYVCMHICMHTYIHTCIYNNCLTTWNITQMLFLSAPIFSSMLLYSLLCSYILLYAPAFSSILFCAPKCSILLSFLPHSLFLRFPYSLFFLFLIPIFSSPSSPYLLKSTLYSVPCCSHLSRELAESNEYAETLPLRPRSQAHCIFAFEYAQLLHVCMYACMYVVYVPGA